MGFFDSQKDVNRTEEMAALARSLRTSFEPEEGSGLIGLLKGFQMYARWNRSQKFYPTGL